MKKLIAITLLFSTFGFGQTVQNQDVEKPIRNLFLAMKTVNPELLRSVFAENAIFQTVTKDGAVKTDNVNNFIASVAKAAKDDLDERIIVEAIHTDGNLASVFTPYEFYYKGQFSHCGANSFQLVKQNNEWKIQYLIDTRRKENCKK